MRAYWHAVAICSGAALVTGLSFSAGVASAAVDGGTGNPCQEFTTGPTLPVCENCVDGGPLPVCECVQPPPEPGGQPPPPVCTNTPPTSICAQSHGVQNSQTHSMVRKNLTPCYRTYECKRNNENMPCGLANPCIQTQTGGATGDPVYEYEQYNVDVGDCEPASPL